MTDEEFIDAHCTIGVMSVGWERASVLACRYCGAFLWDVRQHMASLHPGILTATVEGATS